MWWILFVHIYLKGTPQKEIAHGLVGWQRRPRKITNPWYTRSWSTLELHPPLRIQLLCKDRNWMKTWRRPLERREINIGHIWFHYTGLLLIRLELLCSSFALWASDITVWWSCVTSMVRATRPVHVAYLRFLPVRQIFTKKNNVLRRNRRLQ